MLLPFDHSTLLSFIASLTCVSKTPKIVRHESAPLFMREVFISCCILELEVVLRTAYLSFLRDSRKDGYWKAANSICSNILYSHNLGSNDWRILYVPELQSCAYNKTWVALLQHFWPSSFICNSHCVARNSFVLPYPAQPASSWSWTFYTTL